MDGELVSDSTSSAKESESDIRSGSLFTYTDIFYKQFPYYISIGMTYEQYWDGDSTLPIYYRKAQSIRNTNRNQELWLQGMYIYDALCRVSPVLNAFAKNGTKPVAYTSEPYALTYAEQVQKRARDEENQMKLMLAKMEASMIELNKKFKEGEMNDGNNRPATN